MPPLFRFLLIAAVLAGCAGTAAFFEARAVAGLRADPEGAAGRAAEVAERCVERELRALEASLRARAERLAADPVVRAALLREEAVPEALGAFARLGFPERVAAELYTPEPRLVAWRGPALPPDPATRRLDFLNRPHTAVVADGAFREALVVWEPVREEGRVVGAVRVAELVRVRVPVRNQFLRDVDRVEAWTRGLAAPVRVVFGANGRVGEGARTVTADDGAVLAHVEALRPTEPELERALRRGYADARTFFLTLLAGWALFGLGLLAAAGMRRAAAEPSRGAWTAAGACACALLAGLWGVRYGLLALRVPARFFDGGGLAPAFDPAFLGSGFGGGVAGSLVELVLTAVTVAATGGLALLGAMAVVNARAVRTRLEGTAPLSAFWLVRAAALVGLGVAMLTLVALLVYRATVDATLGFFVRTELLPELLVPPALAGFLLVMLGLVLGLAALPLVLGLRGAQRGGVLLALAVLGLGLAYALTPLAAVLPPVSGFGAFGAAGTIAWVLERNPAAWRRAFSLRGAFLLLFVLAALVYPLAFSAQQVRDDARLREAAEDFAVGEDPRVAFALESALLDARTAPAVRTALARREPDLDSLATDLVAGSLLNALADHRISLVLHAPDGRLLGGYREDAAPRIEAGPTFGGGLAAFSRLRRLYDDEAGIAGVFVERRPTAGPGGRFRFEGIAPVRLDGPTGRLLGWVTARADPRPARYVAETPFPRVLVPAGLYRLAEDEWAFAEFENGVLTRTRGTDFGRFRLPAAVGALAAGEAFWLREPLDGQPVRTYYRRVSAERVVAVRQPAPTVFDHLYFLLRLLVPGAMLVALCVPLGLYVRRSAGPAAPPRLRDRILNRFLLVGLLAVGATGLIGRTVIVTQNREAVEDLLKRRLARVEAALYEEVAGPGESLTPERFLDRARPELIGPRLGLDVTLYSGHELVASSRSQLVRQRLIEPRLPVGVAEALFVEGRRYAFATERVGRFRYTTGYEAIPDADGRPAVVLAVPTLSEQIAIEADQARMLAYLFGVLLLLLGVIFVLATVLADRLARPFRRLREGLRAVGAGEAPEEPIPVESRDEVGEVIETFNAVRDQLEASRRQLAAQERELAWREMARQVAHEIKNPLTPMKLSVQHLQRAHERHGADDERFPPLLDRITHTLIEQIDALSRIAGEFSRFARLPERHLEPLDLNTVLRQAAALLAEEPRATVTLALAEEPLPVTADREELRRVYINLLKNAQQSIPEGERGTITVRSERRTDDEGRAWAWSAVRDTGAGIPEEARARIFTPNFSTKTSGMGLGLAIARKAVEEHGGTIDFETEPGRGTAFFVRLPLRDEA